MSDFHSSEALELSVEIFQEPSKTSSSFLRVFLICSNVFRIPHDAQKGLRAGLGQFLSIYTYSQMSWLSTSKPDRFTVSIRQSLPRTD
jgi:hypothetical protein